MVEATLHQEGEEALMVHRHMVVEGIRMAAVDTVVAVED